MLSKPYFVAKPFLCYVGLFFPQALVLATWIREEKRLPQHFSLKWENNRPPSYSLVYQLHQTIVVSIMNHIEIGLHQFSYLGPTLYVTNYHGLAEKYEAPKVPTMKNHHTDDINLCINLYKYDYK